MPMFAMRPFSHIFILLFLIVGLVDAAEVRTVPSADYPSIQSAIDAAEPGDVIEVAPGTYTEQLVVQDSDKHSIHLVGSVDEEGLPATILDLSSFTGGHGILVLDADDVSLANFEIHSSPNRGVYARRADGITIENVIARDNQRDGFRVRESTNAVLRHCVSLDNAGDGITFYALGSILHSVVGDNAERGIYVYGAAATRSGNPPATGQLTIRSNTVYRNLNGPPISANEHKVGGIIVYSAPNRAAVLSADIKDNEVFENSGPGILIYKVNDHGTGEAVSPDNVSRVKRNVVHGNLDRADRGPGDAILLYMSHYVVIEDNDLTDNESAGIRITNRYRYDQFGPTTHNQVLNNTIAGNGSGLIIEGNAQHDVEDTVAENNVFGGHDIHVYTQHTDDAFDIESLHALNTYDFAVIIDDPEEGKMIYGGALPPGSGSPEAPYQIHTLEHLQAVTNDLNGHYVLMNDIDASATATWNEAPDAPGTYHGFVPIGDIGWLERFRGTFDGQGHVITDLYINRPDRSRVGLFGYVEEGAAVHNLGVANATVIGNMRAGILAGENHGTINKVFSSGFVQGAWATGGLVGENHAAGLIEDAYTHATADVTGYGGGLVGSNQGTVRRTYSTGALTGPAWATGGLIGQLQSGAIEDSYWDTESSGLTTSAGGVGKTTVEMQVIETFTTWNMAALEAYVDHTWVIDHGQAYPLLSWQYTPPPEIMEVTLPELTVDDKNYDGTDTAVIAEFGPLSGVHEGHDVTLDATAATAVFAQSDAGTDIPVTVTGLALSGPDADYYFIQDHATVATISKAVPEVIAWPEAAPIIYGDALSLSALSDGEADVPGTFAFANPATTPEADAAYPASVLFIPEDTANYLSAEGTVLVQVQPREVTVTGSFTVEDRIVTGDTAADIVANSLALNNVLAGDSVTLNPVAAFESHKSGTHTVHLTAASHLTGADASNYQLSLSEAPTTTATITGIHVQSVVKNGSSDEPAGRSSDILIGRLEWEGRTTHPPTPYIIQSTTNVFDPDWKVEAVIPRKDGTNYWEFEIDFDNPKYFRVKIPGPGSE